MTKNILFKSCLMAELCVSIVFDHSGCVSMYIFCIYIYHKQLVSDLKDFTFVNFTSQMSSSADEPIK